MSNQTLGIQDLIGLQLGPYELRALIGIGGMSAVYRARGKSGDVAVKVLLPALVTRYADHFDRIARIRLDHPHIVPIIDGGIQNIALTLNPSPSWRGTLRRLFPFALREKGPGDEGHDHHYLVMPLLTGGTLADRFDKSPFSPQTVSDLLLPLASALDYAHVQGVIHGDIKPGNVLFDDRDTVFLSDFGSTGTPQFTAPEVWRGEPANPASDQYAMGVLAYLLLTGRYPFDSPSRSALKDQHLNGVPISPRDTCPTLPESAAAAVLRALAKLPDGRFPSVSAFVEGIER